MFNSPLGRNTVLHKIIKNDDNHDENDTDNAEIAQKDVDERLSDCLYLQNSDKKKHLNVIKV